MITIFGNRHNFRYFPRKRKSWGAKRGINYRCNCRKNRCNTVFNNTDWNVNNSRGFVRWHWRYYAFCFLAVGTTKGKLLAYGMLSRCETMLVKIMTMLVSQGFNLVYSVLTNGHKKIIKLIGDNFIVSAECSRRSRIFRNAKANSFPNVIGVSRITLDLIGDKFSLCKSNFPFYLSPEVFISWPSHRIICPFSKSAPGIPFSHQSADIVSYTRVRFPTYSKGLKRSMLIKNVIKQQVKSIQLIIYVAKSLYYRPCEISCKKASAL